MFAVEQQFKSEPRPRRPWLLEAGLAVAVIAAVKLLLHLIADRNYGYLNDELYYLDCARHLAWGYVDQPPLIAFITWLVRAVLGDSLSAIRLLPALSGAARILLTGLITREFGGGRLAQGLAALCVLLAPGLLALDHFGGNVAGARHRNDRIVDEGDAGEVSLQRVGGRNRVISGRASFFCNAQISENVFDHDAVPIVAWSYPMFAAHGFCARSIRRPRAG